jgi:hypothetical protein
MPMGRTGIVGLRLFLMWLRDSFTLYSAKTQLGVIGLFGYGRMPPGTFSGSFSYLHSKEGKLEWTVAVVTSVICTINYGIY